MSYYMFGWVNGCIPIYCRFVLVHDDGNGNMDIATRTQQEIRFGVQMQITKAITIIIIIIHNHHRHHRSFGFLFH